MSQWLDCRQTLLDYCVDHSASTLNHRRKEVLCFYVRRRRRGGGGKSKDPLCNAKSWLGHIGLKKNPGLSTAPCANLLTEMYKHRHRYNPPPSPPLFHIVLSLFGATRTSHALDKQEPPYNVSNCASSEYRHSIWPANLTHQSCLVCFLFALSWKHISCYSLCLV